MRTDVDSLWGMPVILTDAIPVGRFYIGALEHGVVLFEGTGDLTDLEAARQEARLIVYRGLRDRFPWLRVPAPTWPEPVRFYMDGGPFRMTPVPSDDADLLRVRIDETLRLPLAVKRPGSLLAVDIP